MLRIRRTIAIEVLHRLVRHSHNPTDHAKMFVPPIPSCAARLVMPADGYQGLPCKNHIGIHPVAAAVAAPQMNAISQQRVTCEKASTTRPDMMPVADATVLATEGCPACQHKCMAATLY